MNTANSHIVQLVRYKEWADDRLFRSLSALPAEELSAKRKIVFGSILRTLNHVYSMDLVWKAHLEGNNHTFKSRNPEQCPEFSELREFQLEIDRWYIDYANNLHSSKGEETVDFVFIGGGDGSLSRFNILLHVVNHTTYHRGHIGDMVYQIPAEPPTTDFPVYLRECSH